MLVVGSNHLASFISPASHTEIDIAGSPISYLISTVDPSYHFSNSYDCVVCTDVLEHLENFHFIFSELLRISSSDVIISLPNISNVFRSYLSRSIYNPNDDTYPSYYYGRYSKYYGLPLFQPSDRHRWFFSYSEASHFINFHSSTYSYVVESEFGPGLSGSFPF